MIEITTRTYLNRPRTRLPYIREEIVAGLEPTRKRVNSSGVGDGAETDGGQGDIPVGQEPDSLPSLRPL